MNEAIKKRLSEFERKINKEICYCLVEMPDGTQSEVDIDTWYEHRREWRWLKMTRGGDIDAIKLVLAAIDEEAAEHCNEP